MFESRWSKISNVAAWGNQDLLESVTLEGNTYFSYTTVNSYGIYKSWGLVIAVTHLHSTTRRGTPLERSLWDEIGRIALTMVGRNWVLLGDFNEIIESSER